MVPPPLPAERLRPTATHVPPTYRTVTYKVPPTQPTETPVYECMLQAHLLFRYLAWF